MRGQGIILFDIDRTIFDTDGMSRLLNQELGRILGAKSLEKIDQIKRDYVQSLERDRYYKPEEFCRRLALAYKFPKTKDLVEVFYGKKFAYIYKQSVFSDFFEVSKKLKNRFRFGIYSEGSLKFQRHKYESMMIDKYFDKNLVFIVRSKDNRTMLKKMTKNMTIIDDKKIICDFLFKNNIPVVWLNKKGEIDSNKYATIHSLSELPSVLLN